MEESKPSVVQKGDHPFDRPFSNISCSVNRCMIVPSIQPSIMMGHMLGPTRLPLSLVLLSRLGQKLWMNMKVVSDDSKEETIPTQPAMNRPSLYHIMII